MTLHMQNRREYQHSLRSSTNDTQFVLLPIFITRLHKKALLSLYDIIVLVKLKHHINEVQAEKKAPLGLLPLLSNYPVLSNKPTYHFPSSIFNKRFALCKVAIKNCHTLLPILL